MPERGENIMVGFAAKTGNKKGSSSWDSLWQINWLEMRYEQTAPPTVVL